VLAKKDQNETVHWYEHDKLGRNTQDRVVKLGSGVDGQVRRIARTYDVRGQVQKITSYSQPAVRTGTVVNEVAFSYNDLGQPVADYQSHDGAAGVATTPVVEYRYDDTTEDGELIKGMRPAALVYPNGRIVRYEYGDAGSSSSSSGAATPTDPDDCLNRIKFIADDNAGAVGTHLAEYAYLGLRGIVTEDYAEPQVKLDYTFDSYAGFDRFGRIIDQRWRNYATTTDLDRYQYGYDRAGNRTYRRNLTTTERDEFCTYDGLNRLIRADRGNLDAATPRIAGTPEHQESWSLDPTGNWSGYRQRDAGGTVLDQGRTHNPANELTAFTASVGTTWSTPSHDRAGNMTRLPKPSDPTEALILRWDAWNRLVKVSDAVGVIAEYSYDGRSYRILTRVYRDPSAPLSALSSPLSRHFYHSSGWQVLEERVGESSLSETQYVWSPRYIDAPILRDRSLSSSTERLYYLGDANFNITALVEVNGVALERYAYAPYGEPIFCSSNWLTPRASSAYDNCILYTGRELDAASGAYHFRMRSYHWGLGAFISRDPILSNVEEFNRHRYVGGNPVNATDPLGLATWDRTGGPYTGGAPLWGGEMHQGDVIVNTNVGRILVQSNNLEVANDADFEAARCALRHLGFRVPQSENGVYWGKVSASGYTILWNGFGGTLGDDLNYSILSSIYQGARKNDDAHFLNLIVTVWHEIKGHNIDEAEDGQAFNDKYERPVYDAYQVAKRDGTWRQIAACCNIGNRTGATPCCTKEDNVSPPSDGGFDHIGGWY
jgi:RHS repeat-associated protein